MADLNDNGTNPQWKEKIRTNEDKIVFAVDPKSSEEEIAAKRHEILMNIGYYKNGFCHGSKVFRRGNRC